MFRIFSVLVMMAVVLVCGILIGTRMNAGSGVQAAAGKQTKMIDAYRLISTGYVDQVNADSLASAGIRGMIQSLDPHSVYLEPEKAAFSNAGFKGNFDGIGIEFDVVRDTLLVVTPLAGGPSEAVGIMPGDRIVEIDSNPVIGIKHSAVLRKLRGERGSRVSLRIYRPLTHRMMDFQV
ncbi:MAG: PDZ domain-containing protein, partial [Chlorobiaceae bacterium]|nr:PDZ domain-containing protein [Chlorobiaceae bacterium]